MARELGVDIDTVQGNGPSGRISVEDVKAHAKRVVRGRRPARLERSAAAPLPDFSRFGEIERQAMRARPAQDSRASERRLGDVPHVTQFDVADITALDELRKKYAKRVEEAGGNLTVTAIATKVAATALRVFPQFNSSIDLAADEIVLKKYVNIGIAVGHRSRAAGAGHQGRRQQEHPAAVGGNRAALGEGADRARSRSTRCRAAASASRTSAASAAPTSRRS
jgi:pyruvate dehydrogenase E2 component (dihydrolipoamide acetyltransferase)